MLYSSANHYKTLRNAGSTLKEAVLATLVLASQARSVSEVIGVLQTFAHCRVIVEKCFHQR